MRKRAGFSLLEALLSFALFILVLSLVVQGVSQLTQVTKYFDGKSQVYSAASDLLQRLASDAHEANIVLLPAPGATATYSQFIFKKIKPAQWANYYATPLPDPFAPRDPALLQQIEYSLSGQDLLCDGEIISNNVQGFTVRRLPDLCLEVRLSYLVKDNLVAFTRLIWLPQMPERVHP